MKTDHIEILLSLIAFIFTILIVVYGLAKGLDLLELFMNFFYFATLLLQQVYSILKSLRN
ncbi:hypothetical protein J4417_00765 [Candidatus Woesearchaeota archaeon]|nr:hypothetical protein [Candidatus Woesearchaeota archaeon]